MDLSSRLEWEETGRPDGEKVQTNIIDPSFPNVCPPHSPPVPTEPADLLLSLGSLRGLKRVTPIMAGCHVLALIVSINPKQPPMNTHP